MLGSLCSADWREATYRNLHARDWSVVDRVMSDAVAGALPLPGDADGRFFTPAATTAATRAAAAAAHAAAAPEETRPKKRHRQTWALTVSYLGGTFSGFAWQRDAPLPTVSGTMHDAILPLLRGRNALRLSCAGRTDAGVSAIGQVVSFYSWAELTEGELARAIEAAAPEPGALRLTRARKVPRAFHATFGATWRWYVYLLPPPAGGAGAGDGADGGEDDCLLARSAAEAEARAIDRLLQPLVGAPRDYAALGRGVARGKDTTMLLRHASARRVRAPARRGDGGGHDGRSAYCTRIDLLGDRFIRRQVRTLVATAVAISRDDDGAREEEHAVAERPAAEGASGDEGARPLDGRLLEACTSRDQARTAHPAPARGLCFAGAGGLGAEGRDDEDDGEVVIARLARAVLEARDVE